VGSRANIYAECKGTIPSRARLLLYVCVCVCVYVRAHALLGPCYVAGNDVFQRISFLWARLIDVFVAWYGQSECFTNCLTRVRCMHYLHYRHRNVFMGTLDCLTL